MIFRLCIALFLLIVPTITFAQMNPASLPTDEEAKKVINFYFHGNNRIYLLDMKLCQEVPQKKGHEKRFECVQELTTGNVLKGETVKVWMNFFAPIKFSSRIKILFTRNGIPEGISKLTVAGSKYSVQNRRFRDFKPGKTGKWEIQVIFEPENGDPVILGRLPVEVQ